MVFFSSLLNVSFSCGGKAVCELHTEGGSSPCWGRHTDAFSVPEHHELWEPFTTPPVQGWSVLSFSVSLNIV